MSDHNFYLHDAVHILRSNGTAEHADACAWAVNEIEQLTRWKSEALEVEREWDAQAIGKLLGLKPGASIRAGIGPAIERLQAALAPFARASANSGTELTRQDFARAAAALSGSATADAPENTQP